MGPKVLLTLSEALALGVYVVFLVVAFGVRPAWRRRKTGRAGWRPPSSPVDLVAEVLYALGCLATASAPLVALTDAVRTVERPLPLAGLGLLLLALGTGIALLAQTQMGEAWQPAAEPGENSHLITGGMFASVRNPFYLGCMLASLGVAVVVPNLASAAGAVMVVVAAHMVVRLVEEPQLAARHASAYDEYRRRTGRFLPRIGPTKLTRR